jgi:two-component system, OmpR family, response regulator VicR
MGAERTWGRPGGTVATVLIVDDEEPVRGFLTMLIRDSGHRVVQAIHGGRALEVVEREKPDLVISDVMMPVLNGAELCRRLKARADTRHIPVILMSSSGKQAADGAGADAFIAKPFELDEMESLVQRWLLPEVHGDDPKP